MADPTPPPVPRVPSISFWVVYDHPKDEPDTYIARRWTITNGVLCFTRDTITCQTVTAIRDWMRNAGLVHFNRSPADDPAILESWL